MNRIPGNFRRSALVVALGTVLSACGGGGSGGGEDTTPLTLTGSVGDGPIVGATVTVRAADGRVLTSAASDRSSRYQVTVDVAPGDLPLTLEATGGTDLVTGVEPDFTLVSATWDSSRTEVHLNPFSTLAVRSAGAMVGGLSAGNLEQARERVTSALAFGLDPNMLGDPINGRVDGQNIADLVKSSEAFGEMLRRVRGALGEGGRTLSVDALIAALGADLTDGSIDGVGADGTDAHVAALANVVVGAVMVEMLANALEVNGVDATAAMDAAVRAVEPATTRVTGDVPITELALTQVRDALELAGFVTPDDALSEFVSDVDRLDSSFAPDDFQRLLNSTRASFSKAMRDVGRGDDSLVSVMNRAVRVIRGKEKKLNQAPVISGTPATTVAEESSYSFVPSATDADGDTLLFRIRNQPAWAEFDPSTGALTGTPDDPDVGTTSNITISVTDGIASSALPRFDLTVTAVNDAPTITGSPATTATVGAPYAFIPVAEDVDGDPLTFSIANKPSWASFNPNTGALSGTPASGDVGTTSGISISVSDGTVSTALTPFSITVQSVAVENSAPTIIGSPATTVAEGSNYTFTPIATDADGDPLQFSIANKPDWASFDPATGTLSGRPAAGDAGTSSGITITVSDGKASASLAPFSITVFSVNNAPTISGTPTTSVNEGQFYTFTPNANDVDGDSLTFSITNKPTWASFSTSTGRLQGTPGAQHVGTTTGIIIRVSDGSSTSSLPGFDLTVVNVNEPPVISGTPPTTVEENTAYTFTPTASDPDGDPLTFSIINKPGWAAFSTGTGRLYGTPGTGSAGSVDGIIISVSDGIAAASLAPFKLTVTAAVTEGSVTLSWQAPTKNVDGTVLTDLAGYRIYAGTASGNYGTPIEAHQGLVTYTLDGLAPDTWYFAVTALDSDGNESEFSNELSAKVGG